MKKLLAIILTALILVSAAAVSVSAYGRRQGADCKANSTGFVDADNDGTCDNRAASGKNNSAGFVDADNDGVCDNIGTGRHCGNGQGRHCGRSR